MGNTFNKFICATRAKKSSVYRKVRIDEFYSDRSRVLYSSSFRRLQQKAQVFSLEPNSSVRTRLTHSLEVSDIGRTLANSIAYQLRRQKLLSAGNVPIVVSIVENACLLHDIGNPPFGHFGEAAIKDWAKKFLEKHKNDNQEPFHLLMEDFIQFDGNPQGFRTVTKLHTERDEKGLNLTYSTLLCILKYSRAAGEAIDPSEGICKDIIKKAGYFQSEKELVKSIYSECGLNIHHRYPFTYIMEAADDIAYCMSDIADGIEKGILTEKSFIEEFVKEWKKTNLDENGTTLPFPKKISTIKLKNKKRVKLSDKNLTDKIDPDQLFGFNIDISIPWSKAASSEAIKCFMDHIDEIYCGNAKSLISKEGEMGRVLETIKSVSRKLLYTSIKYTSIKAESIELTGFSVITGILNRYERLLELSGDDFEKIVNHQLISGCDYERRLFNRLGLRYVRAYQYAVEKLDKTDAFYKVNELWLRIHLVIDHISGMTDEYALETYQMLEGIQLLNS